MRKKLSIEERRRQIEELVALPDEDIDTTDIPEAPQENWIYAQRATDFYRARKQAVTIRLDADVVAWFKDHAEGRGYQTEINRVLRRHVADAEKKRA
jgi:uncharacterized protein (DUF4415 family)